MGVLLLLLRLLLVRLLELGSDDGLLVATRREEDAELPFME